VHHSNAQVPLIDTDKGCRVQRKLPSLVLDQSENDFLGIKKDISKNNLYIKI
jgi:hypothetical protein